MSFQSLIPTLFISLILTVSCTHKKKVITEDAKAESTKVSQSESEKAYGCDVKGDIRIVKVDKSPQRCEVSYKKFGESEQVAWAESTPEICSRVFNQIRTNIESKGFTCTNDIASLTKSEKTASLK